VKDLGNLNYFLGVETIPISDGLFLTQRMYIIDLLKRCNMALSKPASTPMESTCSLFAHTGKVFDYPVEKGIEKRLE